MKFLLLLALLFPYHSAFARTQSPYLGSPGGDFGLGIILGEPTGITGKYWQNKQQALDGGFAYSWDNYFVFYLDELWHFNSLIRSGSSHGRGRDQLNPYLGVGGVLWINGGTYSHPYFSSNSNSNVGIGLRIPLGLEYRPATVPLGVFLEIVPGLGFVPGMFPFLQAGIGARYYF